MPTILQLLLPQKLKKKINIKDLIAEEVEERYGLH